MSKKNQENLRNQSVTCTRLSGTKCESFIVCFRSGKKQTNQKQKEGCSIHPFFHLLPSTQSDGGGGSSSSSDDRVRGQIISVDVFFVLCTHLMRRRRRRREERRDEAEVRNVHSLFTIGAK
jgi:hypothetical protein